MQNQPEIVSKIIKTDSVRDQKAKLYSSTAVSWSRFISASEKQTKGAGLSSISFFKQTSRLHADLGKEWIFCFSSWSEELEKKMARVTPKQNWCCCFLSRTWKKAIFSQLRFTIDKKWNVHPLCRAQPSHQILSLRWEVSFQNISCLFEMQFSSTNFSFLRWCLLTQSLNVILEVLGHCNPSPQMPPPLRSGRISTMQAFPSLAFI